MKYNAVICSVCLYFEICIFLRGCAGKEKVTVIYRWTEPGEQFLQCVSCTFKGRFKTCEQTSAVGSTQLIDFQILP